MNYKKQSAALLILALGLGLQACSKEDVEIVSFNPAYSLDKNAIFVDIPAEYKYNANNIIRYQGASELSFTARLAAVSGGPTTIADNQITLNFSLRRPFTQPTEFVLEEDRNLLDSYTGVKEGFEAMPAGVVEPLRFTLPANQSSVSTTISIRNFENLTSMPGYLTAYRIKPADPQTAIEFSQNQNILYVKVKVANAGYIGDASNGQQVTAREASWNKLASNLFTSSSNSTKALAPLFDNNRTSVWYENGQRNIDLTLNDATNLKGIGFFVASGYAPSYPIKTVTVKAQEDGSTDWVSQGTFTITTPQEFYIKFRQGIDAKKVRLEIAGDQGNIWVLSELEIYN